MTFGRTWSIVVVLCAATGLYVMTASATPPVKTAATPPSEFNRLNLSTPAPLATPTACGACAVKKSNQEAVAAKKPTAPVRIGTAAAPKGFSAVQPAQWLGPAAACEEVAAQEEFVVQKNSENEVGVGLEACCHDDLNQPLALSRHLGVMVNRSRFEIQANQPQASEWRHKGVFVVRGRTPSGAPWAMNGPHQLAHPPNGPAIDQHMVALTIENEHLKAREEAREHLIANAARFTEVLVQNARLEARLEAMEDREELFEHLIETTTHCAAIEAKAEAIAEWREERNEILGELMQSTVDQAIVETRQEIQEQNKALQLRVIELEREILELIAARAKPAAQVSTLPQTAPTPHGSD